MKKNARRLAMVLFAAVFVVSATLLARDLFRSNKEKADNQALAQQVRQVRDAIRLTLPEGAALPEGPSEEELILAEYAALAQQNRDLTGWLWIEGTNIDYPVMHTPEDPEYYLRRNFEKKRAISGTLFLDGKCDPAGDYALVYGHHMKDGSMFGDLDHYQTLEYAQAHPVIRFDTLDEIREYEVVTAFFSKIYRVNETEAFQYYLYTGLPDQETFQEYFDQVGKLALYDTGVEPVYGDRILVLSTCSYHTKNGRFVVVARQRAEG